jgi:hypothetical protein
MPMGNICGRMTKWRKWRRGNNGIEMLYADARRIDKCIQEVYICAF